MIDREIVDRIDRLVGEQLAAYENRSGYDANVNQERCPRCGREWHGLAITERMEQMRLVRTFDDNYRHARDTSRVLCPGSMFVGPTPLESAAHTGFDVLAAWRDMVWAAREADPRRPHLPAEQAGGTAPAVGVTGGCDRASWHCARCGAWATIVETVGAANAFANALQGYAAHIARTHEIELATPFDVEEFAARFGLPVYGVLWDADHTVIGSYGPGGSTFEADHTPRELKGFGAIPPPGA
ncbi:hypothetical protein GFY24_22770 [Nocardia sp. SYP-A9097]|uniref:hypothetical protein n=1 Tax=Nocardia sp. SYP-A9097 TaxID=2663237 RepID=UPI00129B5629|nr:hypothetical protein [Nocardia sp. SYP-A9097]MRH90227.1 hypothetical protein [Nocardia sp. SYP-A9097]